MMDVSDGLVLDATRLAAASGVTIDLRSSSIGGESELSGGEDHALLATFPPQASRPEGFRVVGEVVPAGGDAVLIDGQAPRGRGGWDPYADWDAGRG